MYDGTLRAVRDLDLMFWRGSQDPTISSTTSGYSHTIDLGDTNIFANIPVHVAFEATGTISCLSIHSAGLTASKCSVPGFWLQDAADGSTFSDIAFVKMPGDASLDCTATLFNAMRLGVVNPRRYLRLKQQFGCGTAGEVRSWLRMGLTA